MLQLLQLPEAQHASLFPPLATCLQFSPEEVSKLKRAREANSYLPSLPSLFRTRDDTLTHRWLATHEGGSGESGERREGEDGGRRGERLHAAQLAVLSDELTSVEIEVKASTTSLHLSHSKEAGLLSLLARREVELASLSQSVGEVEAQQTANDGDMCYLRNVMKRYMETEDHEALFPVIATCMRFSPEEVEQLHANRLRRQQQVRGLFF